MRLFIVLFFLVMGLAYWALSGGAGFRPEPWPTEARAAPEPATAPVTPAADVVTEVAAPGGIEEAPAAVVPAQAAPPAPGPGPAAEPISPGDALIAIAPDLAPPAEEAPAAGADLRTVTGDRVNMREGPGTDFAVVGQMTAGEAAEVLEERDGWARVRAPGGPEGWMSARFLAAAGG